MRQARKINVVPTEDEEAYDFADWLEGQGDIAFTHIANEVGSQSQSAKIRAFKARRMGQRPGVWDYELFIPVYNCDGEIDVYQEARVELKRVKGGTVSEKQKEWGAIYEKANIPHKVCKGAREAIKFVQDLRLEIGGYRGTDY